MRRAGNSGSNLDSAPASMATTPRHNPEVYYRRHGYYDTSAVTWWADEITEIRSRRQAALARMGDRLHRRVKGLPLVPVAAHPSTCRNDYYGNYGVAPGSSSLTASRRESPLLAASSHISSNSTTPVPPTVLFRTAPPQQGVQAPAPLRVQAMQAMGAINQQQQQATSAPPASSTTSIPPTKEEMRRLAVEYQRAVNGAL
eukprot:PhM_4_TR14890/c0_g1_i1/m.106180